MLFEVIEAKSCWFQTHRRKLEEVSVKLEALKDRLRYDSVSGAVVESLNGIANGKLEFKTSANRA